MTTDVDLAHHGRPTEEAVRTTDLTLEGIEPDDVTGEFLTDVMDAASAHGLAIDGISVRRRHE